MGHVDLARLVAGETPAMMCAWVQAPEPETAQMVSRGMRKRFSGAQGQSSRDAMKLWMAGVAPDWDLDRIETEWEEEMSESKGPFALGVRRIKARERAAGRSDAAKSILPPQVAERFGRAAAARTERAVGRVSAQALPAIAAAVVACETEAEFLMRLADIVRDASETEGAAAGDRPRMSPETLHGEIDTGPAQGREEW